MFALCLFDALCAAWVPACVCDCLSSPITAFVFMVVSQLSGLRTPQLVLEEGGVMTPQCMGLFPYPSHVAPSLPSGHACLTRAPPYQVSWVSLCILLPSYPYSLWIQVGYEYTAGFTLPITIHFPLGSHPSGQAPYSPRWPASPHQIPW